MLKSFFSLINFILKKFTILHLCVFALNSFSNIIKSMSESLAERLDFVREKIENAAKAYTNRMLLWTLPLLCSTKTLPCGGQGTYRRSNFERPSSLQAKVQ